VVNQTGKDKSSRSKIYIYAYAYTCKVVNTSGIWSSDDNFRRVALILINSWYQHVIFF